MQDIVFIETLVIFTVILINAKILEEIFQELKMSPVLGDLAAGVIFGPSLFGIIDPFNNQIIKFLAEIGVIILLFEVGLHSNVYKLLKSGVSSVLVAGIGVLLPFLAGFLFFIYSGFSEGSSLFIGATLTATSVGVSMRVLSDMGKLESEEGRIILGAAVIDDILGLIILSVVIGIVATGNVSFVDIGRISMTSIMFLVITTWVGIKFAPRIFNIIMKIHLRGLLLVSAFAFALLLSIFSQLIGLATIIGAFAAGLILECTKQKKQITEQIESLYDIFVPLFFITAGAYLNIASVMNMKAVGLMISLFVIAVIGKFVAGFGCYSKKIRWMAVGVGMIPRGEVALIFLTFGLAQGIIGNEIYSAFVIVTMVTTFMAPILLKPLMAKKIAKTPGKVLKKVVSTRDILNGAISE